MGIVGKNLSYSLAHGVKLIVPNARVRVRKFKTISFDKQRENFH